jgi:hypothetical protein
MIDIAVGAIPGMFFSGYESFVRTFGSLETQLALSVTLVTIAAVELYLRKCRNPEEVA